MSSVNKVILIGNLGQDPEMRETKSGSPVCNFSVATSERYKSKDGEQVENTEWHRVVAFGKTAELCGEYLSKGKKVYLEGNIQSRQYEDKEGVSRTAFEIKANQVTFLTPKSEGKASAPF